MRFLFKNNSPTHLFKDGDSGLVRLNTPRIVLFGFWTQTLTLVVKNKIQVKRVKR